MVRIYTPVVLKTTSSVIFPDPWGIVSIYLVNLNKHNFCIIWRGILLMGDYRGPIFYTYQIQSLIRIKSKLCLHAKFQIIWCDHKIEKRVKEGRQGCGSNSFLIWIRSGSGSAEPVPMIMDPDPAPAPDPR